MKMGNELVLMIQYRSTDFIAPGPGRLTLTFTPADGTEATEMEVYNFKGKGVAMAMYNTDESIKGFAHASFKMAIQKKMPLFMSTKKCVIFTSARSWGQD
jgi:isocitrate dehydrogenase